MLAITAALYVPFLSNQLVFDDTTFFYRPGIMSHYAVTPFDLSPRTFPYFTFSFTHAIYQSFEAQRLFNLFLHGTNAWLTYLVLMALLSTAKVQHDIARLGTTAFPNTVIAAFLFAAAFALHPTAVYGTAYLVQRTILFATFFSLLSVITFLCHVRENRNQPLVLSALFASAAIFSKEHAVMLPFAIVLLIPATGARMSHQALRKSLLYLLMCLPAMFAAYWSTKGVVFKPYEVHAELFSDDTGPLLWLRSILTQCWLFLSYVRLWLVPDTALMSIDLRFAVELHWLNPRSIAGGLAFVAASTFGLMLTFGNTRYKLAGYGLIYTIILFSIELSTIRTQEPFVLYRSYLWAPGLVICIFALVARIPGRIPLILLAAAIPILAFQAINRLQSLTTSKSVWEDAAAKLQSDRLPGAFRIYFNRGLNYFVGAGSILTRCTG